MRTAISRVQRKKKAKADREELEELIEQFRERQRIEHEKRVEAQIREMRQRESHQDITVDNEKWRIIQRNKPHRGEEGLIRPEKC